MTTDCHSKNPLVRDGTSQTARFPKMLDPALAPIDDRSLLDLLSFVRRFSKEINYYDIDGKVKGDWEDFFSHDEIFLPVAINDFQVQHVQNSFSELASLISTETDSDILKTYFKALFDLIFHLAYQLDNWHQRSTPGLALSKELARIISADLKTDFRQLYTTYLEANESPTLVAPANTITLPYQVQPLESLEKHEFSDEWIIGDSKSWRNYLDSLRPDPRFFRDIRSNTSAAIKSATTSLLRIGEKQTSAVLRLASASQGFLEDALHHHSAHEPHNTLIITFLELFKYNQKQLNHITSRHLDFFYKRVLQLEPKEEVAAKAHVYFELINSKHILSHQLPEGTLLKAGKDAKGNPVFFQTASDLIVSKAEISEVKSFFIDRGKGYFPYLAEVSNSKDGLGEKFEIPGTPWKAFGQSQFSLSESEKHMMPASIGWVFATPALYLAEGVRRIDLVVSLEGLTKTVDIHEVFDTYLTGKSGWLKVHADFLESAEGEIGHPSTLTIAITLLADTEPIVNFDPKIHKGNFPITLPAIKFICKAHNDQHAYEALKDLTVTEITIDVEATVTDLSIQNDASSLDPSGPFLPFGPQPERGSSFIIGSREVFSKKLTALSLHGKWLNYPAGTAAKPDGFAHTYAKYRDSPTITRTSFLANFKKLENGNWMDLAYAGDREKILFEADETLDIALNLQHSNYQPEHASETYEKGVKSGFIKAEIAAPSFGFGHGIYPQLYSKATVEEMNNSISGDPPFNADNLPLPPYTPKLTDFSVAYKASDELDLRFSNPRHEAKFLHVHPFGFTEEAPAESLSLLPRFGHRNEGNTWVEHEGTLFIGITDVNPPESLNLYIEVSEGSENPDKLSEEIQWFYLSGNEWILFEDTDLLSDSTQGFLKSGIVKFELPKKMTRDHTIMPTGLFWLKAVIAQNSDAVCEVIELNPHGVLAAYDNRNNDPNYLANTIPAQTITKLNARESAIKSLQQPYGSFEGKIAENSIDFYTRVSERLRHKSRGIALWDYERLVLEAYPDLYKVKAINHSTYNRPIGGGNTYSSEFAPGYITVIVVPDVSQKNLPDPYRPRASKAKLADIKSFLQSRMPASVQSEIQVQNPLFEQIQVDFEVEFSKPDRGYHEKKLNEDIKKFLSPWAFEEGKEINFGGKIHKSTILHYIEKLSYVDYVAYFKMNQLKDNTLLKENIDVAYPSTAKTIFVTITADSTGVEHIIKEISK